MLKVLAAGCSAVGFAVVVIASVVATVVVFDHNSGPLAPPTAGSGSTSAPSPDAVSDIPPEMLVLYQRAADVCPGLDWSVLASIGKIETDHGRAQLPGVASGENFAGAGGPMQFLALTFEQVVTRHAMPPGGASPPSRYNPSDAVHAAAYYLCDSGAPADMYRAIWAYNNADWYVRQVLDQARRYATPAPPKQHPGAGDCATIHAAPTAATVLRFACDQLGMPYVWGGNGPVDGGWDCSGLTKAAYAVAGISLPRVAHDQYHATTPIPDDQLQPGDLVFYGTAGNLHHVGIYLGAGKMINAPTFGQPVQIADYRREGDQYYGATRPLLAPTTPNENQHL
ncbi:C40 family peptidase [Nocardia cyriacigeorgica]|uniref:Hydrolase Nlp/P60 n=1 Tax=Nocardia cyriacigeorgica TaxID=135487 RepID=A0A5R8PE95_9NOCA|nr:C40 family peptidase [Nocardia cyriacigeorgica]MBF6095735.1 C40 family peptidase [Nocardia cyriacigeorgica]TLF73663.1 hydrolase Nlp/P60 [Nocardia cyriacigeorgica]TLG10246.1 hydrolase Nlp/P60 [Nocardia cyriacigeorgica]